MVLAFLGAALAMNAGGQATGTVPTDISISGPWQTPISAYSNSTIRVHAVYGFSAPGFQPIDVPAWTAVWSIDGVVVGRFQHPERHVGGQDGDAINWNATAPGRYEVRVEVDVDGNVTETNEDNNVAIRSLRVLPRVDVSAQILSVSPGPSPLGLSTVETRVQVCNALGDASPAMLHVDLWQHDAQGFDRTFATEARSFEVPSLGCAVQDVVFRDVYGVGQFEVRATTKPGLVWQYPFPDASWTDNTDAMASHRLVDAPGEMIVFPISEIP